MELKICHLYPDVLNLYGDTGNIICMKNRLMWRGIDVSVTDLPIGETQSLAEFDLFFMGGGQDFEQEVLLEDLHRGKDKSLVSAIEDGKTFLAICGGYQMLGNYYLNASGHRCDFLGAVDFYTVGSSHRMIGNYAFRCTDLSGGSVVVGFENHSGRTFWATVSNRWAKLSRAMVITVKIRRKVSATKMFLAHTAMARCCRKILSSAITFFSQHWSVNTELVFFLRWMIPQKLTRIMQRIGN